MQNGIRPEPSLTGDEELDELLAAVPAHLRVELAEINRHIPSQAEWARWHAASISQQAEAFERYGGDADAQAARAVKAAAKYLITKAKNS